MNFLYKDGNKLIFDIGTITIYDEGDPDLDLFQKGHYKNFSFEISVNNLTAMIDVSKKFLSTNIVASDISYSDGLHSFYIDELKKDQSSYLYDEIDYFANNPKDVLLLPLYPDVDTKIGLKDIPYYTMFSSTEKMYFFEHGLYKELYYDVKASTAVLSTYVDVLKIKVPPAQFPILLETIANTKSSKDIKSIFPVNTVETIFSFTRDMYNLIKIIELPNVLALVEDEEEGYYFRVYSPKDGKIIKYYTNPQNASIWKIVIDGNEAELQMSYIDFYDYLIKYSDEDKNRNVII